MKDFGFLCDFTKDELIAYIAGYGLNDATNIKKADMLFVRWRLRAEKHEKDFADHVNKMHEIMQTPASAPVDRAQWIENDRRLAKEWDDINELYKAVDLERGKV